MLPTQTKTRAQTKSSGATVRRALSETDAAHAILNRRVCPCQDARPQAPRPSELSLKVTLQRGSSVGMDPASATPPPCTSTSTSCSILSVLYCHL
uniref:Uncharacterized protein n=1 Tax=Knipowitschia caucasica TaxID=637954 RepID=A0AAV2J0W9_KNICA